MVYLCIVLQCCQSIWRSKIVSNPKDKVAILLNATAQENDEGQSDFKNLYMLQPLQKVTVAMIQELLQIDSENKDNGCSSFRNSLGSSSQFNMMDLFWKAKLIFDEE